jgi:hypothetical protein
MLSKMKAIDLQVLFCNCSFRSSVVGNQSMPEHLFFLWTMLMTNTAWTVSIKSHHRLGDEPMIAVLVQIITIESISVTNMGGRSISIK